MRFRLYCKDLDGEAVFYYDNSTGLLHRDDGSPVGNPRADLGDYQQAVQVHPMYQPIRKHNAPRVLKIQFGLSCNYSCSYCLQKAVDRPDQASLAGLPGFLEKVRTFLTGAPDVVQLWGGEPLVYIKPIRALTAELKRIYPNAMFTMVTNGSLLSPEINDWIMENDIAIALSHDGPGQSFRGPDPFEEEHRGAHIRDLYWRKKKAGKPMSVGAMIHAQNYDRAKVAAWLIEKFDDADIVIGEGSFIDVYDATTMMNCPSSDREHVEIRKVALDNIRRKADRNFITSRQRMSEWLTTMIEGRMLASLGMKCGMDQADTLTVDLAGNVLTCQNTSSVAFAPNGQPHRSGSIEAIDDVQVRTSTHFAYRRTCLNCPVVQVCKGGCMYLEGKLFEKSCENMYTDHVPYLAAAVEALTGLEVVYIEDEANLLPESRRDLFGLYRGSGADPYRRRGSRQLNVLP